MEQATDTVNIQNNPIVIKESDETPLIITRKPLDPQPFATHMDKQPKAKSNYKEEKNLRNLKKMESNAITLSGFEKKVLKKTFDKFEKKTIVHVRDTRDTYNMRDVTEKSPCFTGDNCIVWYCQFEHSDARKKECKCNENTCDKLHAHQALCKNKKHADDCAIAHRMQDIKN